MGVHKCVFTFGANQFAKRVMRSTSASTIVSKQSAETAAVPESVRTYENVATVNSVLDHRFVFMVDNAASVSNAVDHRFADIVAKRRSVKLAVARKFVLMADAKESVRTAFSHDFLLHIRSKSKCGD